MRMVTCNNGHYYDQEKNVNCPYCNNTVGMNMNNNGSDSSIQEEKTAFYGNDESEKTALYQNPVADDERTVFHTSTSAAEPKVLEKQEESIVENKGPILLSGWLAVISEGGRGASHALTFGMNTIGRSEANHVCIKNCLLYTSPSPRDS